jgi:hypothetical protein
LVYVQLKDLDDIYNSCPVENKSAAITWILTQLKGILFGCADQRK